MVQFYKIILLISLIYTYPAFGISVSVSSNCQNGAIQYNFNNYSVYPDIKIKFSSYAYNPDYIFKEVIGKHDADIVVEDNNTPGFTVCKSSRGKTIKLSEYENDPDFTIQISKYVYGADYTIFNDSKIFTTEEVISILLLPNFIQLD